MQKKSNSFLNRILVLFTFSLMLYGCGIWTNFTTYFNLYYDAKDLFDQAEDDIKKLKTDIFAEEEMQLPTTTGAQLLKVEEKCSQILQFHSQSGYVDKSLFIIGKCFYYTGNYRKSLRKFEELIATQPKSSLILETRLWIGKCQMKLKDFDKSLESLKSTREEAIKQGEKEIAQDSYVEEIKYQIFKKDYNAAIDLAKSFLTISNNDELNSQVAFEIGKLYVRQGDFNNAVTYYKKVNDYSPTFDIRFNSLIEQGKALRELGENNKAITIFNQLSKEQKYSDALDQIDFERGITYLKMDNKDKAMDMFMLVDTAYSKMPSAGKSAFELGRIFLNSYKNFDSAAYYFNRVFSSTAPKEYIDSARTYTDQLRQYGILFYTVTYNSKQLTYALDSTAYIKDSVYYYAELARKLKEAKADSLRKRDDASFRKLRKDTEPGGNNQKNQAGQNQTAQNQQGQTQPNQNQSGQQQNQQQAGQTGTGQQQAGQQTQLGQQDSSKQQPGMLQNTAQAQVNTDAQSLQLLQWQQLKSISRPPTRPTSPIDTLTNNLVKSEFELGNLLFFEFNYADSAYKYYSDVILNYPESNYQGRALYALGDYYLAINDTLKADSLFNIVYDKFKNETIVNSAALKLHKPEVDLNYDSAKVLYVQAESLMTSTKYDSSIANMYKIYLTHPKSPFASKALYAIGWMLENRHLNDSAAVVYDTLTKNYPKTVYSSNVLPKLNFYKSELVRIKKAKEDSIFAAKNPKLKLAQKDSLSVDKQKSGLIASGTQGANLPPGGIPGEKVPADRPGGNRNIPEANTVANPDTLIRARGRGIRRVDK